MPMMRIKDQQYEKLEKMAVAEKQRNNNASFQFLNTCMD